MNYSGIKYTDMINGEGIRVSLFVSGCSHYCKDCFNSDTWDPNYGSPFTEDIENEILNYFKKYDKSIKGWRKFSYFPRGDKKQNWKYD